MCSIVLGLAANPSNDLGTPAAERAIFRAIRARPSRNRGAVKVLGLELPCNTWSLARRENFGPPPLRDNSASGLYGLPDLKATDQLKVNAGNFRLAQPLASSERL